MLGLARRFYPESPENRRGPIKLIISGLPEVKPEWVRKYPGKGRLLTYYSFGIAKQVGRILEERAKTRNPRRGPTKESIAEYQITKNREATWRETITYIESEQSIEDAKKSTNKIIALVKTDKGRIRWYALARNPQLLSIAIESEVEKFLQAGFELTSENIAKYGLPGLRDAIIKYYPGKINGVRERFGLEGDRVPYRYWQDIENIKKGALEFYSREGSISPKILYDKGYSGLYAAIRTYYPGGFFQMLKDMGFAESVEEVFPEDADNELRKLMEE